MLFNSWEFVTLVIVTLFVYYLPYGKRWQIYVLLVASFVFYVVDSFGLLLLLLASGLLNSVSSYMARYNGFPRFYATLGVVSNLLLLSLFKYGGLFFKSFGGIDTELGHFLCVLPLPLGISFYTFSGISLVVDAYKDRLNPNLDHDSRPSFWIYFRDTMLYVSFFPKLLAGPIVKSREFFDNINEKLLHHIDWQFVFKSLVIGYFMKMVVADNLKDFTFWLPFRYSCYMGSGSLLTLVFGYSIQMFADFAGYSLIAIGIAALFGYRLPDNFNYPYISKSFREFWKRWHITLSQFLMEYLYISLGGNRKGRVRTYVNLLLTMMLGGLWHGAAWNFLMWGTYHGFCLVVERVFCGRRDFCLNFGTSRFLTRCSIVFSMLFVFVMVSFGWLLFKLPLGETVRLICAIGKNWDKFTFFEMRFFPVLIYMLPVFFYHFIYLLREKKWIQQYVYYYSYILYGLMLFLIVTNSGSVSQFVYFQF
ncbi:MAG: hypothetical protein K6E14_01475 [Paludibacteraceae bacterium]|nr:hypothetical protein [Paludibacteraceae bacterium]